MKPTHGALRYFGRVKNGTTPASGEPEYWDGEVRWATPEDLGKLRGDKIADTKRRVTEKAVEETNLNVLPRGAVLISTRAPIGHMAITDEPMAFNQGCRGIIPADEVHGPFLYYLLKSRAPELNAVANGTTFVELSRDELAALAVAFPPLDAQRRIARYLDEKTVRIDGLIEKKRALLDRLAEKRQALITRAVTKGLSPDAPMKPSGIDWLGDIPAHWEVRRLKSMVSIWGRIGFRGYTVADIVDAGEGALSLSPSNIVDGEISYSTATYLSWEKYYESPEIMVSDDDLLFVKTGSTIGKVCHVGNISEPMTINPQLVVLKPILGLQKFVYYAMRSAYFQHQVSGQIFGGSTPAMTQQNLGSLFAVVAPLQEQRNIVTYLDRCGNEYREVATYIVESVKKLQEYRASLITSAVTGGIGELQ